MNGRSMLRRYLIRGALPVLAAALALSGCGGSSAGSTSSASATGTTAAAILAELRNATGKTAAAVRTCRVLIQPTTPTPSPST